MQIPILKLPFDEALTARITARISTVLQSGQLVLGANVRGFEQRWREVHGLNHAVACSTGTSALELLLRGHELHEADVVVPDNTFFATAAAVVATGNRAVLADVSPAHGCLTAETVTAAATPATRAVLVVHNGGIISDDIIPLQRLCAARNWLLFEDCAHAHCCRYDGNPAGGFGVGGAFSFFPTKVLMTGEGGAVSTNDAVLAQRLRVLLNHGKDTVDGKAMHTVTGDNWRLSEIHAAVGCEVLALAHDLVAARQRIAGWYDELLIGANGIAPLKRSPKLECSFYKYIVRAARDFDRAALKNAMQAEGISLTGEVYAELLHEQPVMVTEKDNYRMHGDYDGALQFSRRHFCLPLYPQLTSAEAEHVVARVRDWFGKH